MVSPFKYGVYKTKSSREILGRYYDNLDKVISTVARPNIVYVYKTTDTYPTLDGVIKTSEVY